MDQKRKMRYTSQKGITLIALVITIIVLLILAGVTISMVLGDDGIISQAQQAKKLNKSAAIEEELAIIRGEIAIENYGGIPADLDSKTTVGVIERLVEKGIVNAGELEEKAYRVIGFKDESIETTYSLKGIIEWNNADASKLIIENGVLTDVLEEAANIVIPEGVTSIAAGAFYDCYEITTIMIPETVTSISSGAFQNYCNLSSIEVDIDNPVYASVDGILYNKAKTEIIHVPCSIEGSITIPKGITSISKLVDIDNIGMELTDVNIEEGNANYTSVDGVVYNKEKTEIILVPYSKTEVKVADGITELDITIGQPCQSLILPDSIRVIKSIYGGGSGLNITIPEGVTTFEEKSFCIGESSSVEELFIPSTVTSLEGAFPSNGYSGYFSKFVVDEDNPVYTSVDGIIYKKDKTEIVAVPSGLNGEITIPKETTSIDKLIAFDRNEFYLGLTDVNIEEGNANYISVDGVVYNKEKTEIILVPFNKTEVQIADGLNSITSAGCFHYNIQSLIIPSSVTSISDGVFSNLWFLNKITFVGNETFTKDTVTANMATSWGTTLDIIDFE